MKTNTRKPSLFQWKAHREKAKSDGIELIPDGGAGNKTKMVAWFVSNCNARNRRLEYARELAKHVQVI